jgi:asparagine synthase (glutamine-hydrolysing)
MDQAILTAAKEKRIGLFLSGYGGDFFVSDKGNEVIFELIKQLRIGSAWQLMHQLKHTENKSYFTLFKSEFARYIKIGKSIISYRHRNQLDWQRHSMLTDEYFNRHKHNIDFNYISHPVKFMLDYIESGRMGRVMGMWANRSGAYAMESAVPLFDKQINEFMFDVPIEQYLAGGNRRSLIRRAMEGILPPEIQWRKDKLPYTPDFHRRIITEKKYIEPMLNDSIYNFVWKYLDKSKIEQHLEGVKPVQNMGEWMTNGGNRVVKGIIAFLFIIWLKKQLQ